MSVMQKMREMEAATMTVAAAIPTYNRLELLKLTVHSLRNQTRKPDEIIIVNTGTSDDTAEWLSRQNDLFVVTQPNSGATGGFFSTIKIGYERKHDWILCLDDDAVLREDALEKMIDNPHFLSSSTGFLCCRVVDPEGRTYMTPVPIDPFPKSYNKCMKWYDTMCECMCVRVGYANWAGFMVSREAVRRCGLPIREFFIEECDKEYSERIARKMLGYCVLNAVVVHYQAKIGGDYRKLYQARNRFARILIADMPVRNKIYRVFKSTGWLVVRILFGGYPAKCFLWALWGLFTFRPKIEFVDV
jgi:GT2 family glycosyltransferase